MEDINAFDKIDRARKILGLSEYASLNEIKEIYRHLIKKYHPDSCTLPDKADCEKKVKEINEAKDIILTYCTNYKFSFKKDAVLRNSVDIEYYRHLKQFYDGWWNNIDS